jgi:PHD/YefM family antitoxin component YafN of YafNO toxin-antitoxin module
MVIQLTPQQLQALDTGERGPPRVVDPRGNVSYVLVSESEYETVRDILEDERRQRSIRAVGLLNAIGRMSEVP